MRTEIKIIYSLSFLISPRKRDETPSWSLSGLRTCGWQFSSPCSHSSILRYASKWLISPRALRRSSSQSRSACANVSSGNGDFFWAPEHHCYFTSRMFSLREVQVIPLHCCRHTIHFVLIQYLKWSHGPYHSVPNSQRNIVVGFL